MKIGGRHFNWFALVLVNLLWAAQYPAYSIASARMSAAALNFWTLLFATVLLASFAVVQRHRAVNPAPYRWRRDLLPFLLLGILGILPPSVLMAWGIARSTASNASILSLTIPVMMTVLAVVMLGEKLTWFRTAGLVLALAGTLVISWSDVSSDLMRTRLLVGNAVILAAGAGSAYYNTYSKALLERFSELEVLVGGYIVGGLACLVISLLVDKEPLYRVGLYGPRVWLSIAVLGGLSWGIAMVLWMGVLKRIDASQASVSIYLLSVFGVLLSAVTLGEKVTLPQLLGGALVFAATWLTTEVEQRRAKAMA